MRFEIGPGGGFVVLVGLLGLSAAVFFLGTISGREMARSEIEQGSHLATVYPMPAAPAATPSPAAAAAAIPRAAEGSPAVAQRTPHPSNPPIASVGAPAAHLPKPVPRRSAEPERVPAAHPHPALAGIPQHHPTPAAASTAAGGAQPAASPVPAREAATHEGGLGSHGPSPATPHHRGYNIVINAAMDRAGADRMVSRLLALGYSPHVVPTQINGQTWYKVQVGPYPTAEDARAAQEQLRDAYTTRYVTRPAAN